MSLSPGTIVFRADAGVEIGTGHVMRSLALAQAWQDIGGNAVFVLQHSTAAIVKRLKSEGFETLVLPSDAQQDAVLTVEAAAEHGADWAVLDGYNFGNGYRTVLKNAGLKLLCIDDNGENCELADIILNSNLYAQREPYSDAAQHSVLLGPKFALLRREFRRCAQARQRRSGQRVLITMGGSDPRRLTEIALRAVQLVRVADLEVRVAASSSNPRRAELIAYCTKHNLTLSVDGSMPELMCWADLAVAASGTTCLELCFCGLPAIVIDAAPNQLATARELQRLGVAVHVPLSQATDSQIAEKIRMLLGNHETLEQMSRASKGLVDGRGAERVVAAIIAFSLKMRRADASDAQLLWEWTNDPAVRQASFKSTPVSWKEHEHWFAARLKDRESSLFVFDNPARGAAAAVRFEAEHPDVSKISITIAREYRGLGLAPHVIQRAVSAIFEQKSAHEIRAFVKPENTASSSAFQRAGFSFAGTTRVHECEALIYVLHRSDAQWLPSDAAEEVECG